MRREIIDMKIATGVSVDKDRLTEICLKAYSRFEEVGHSLKHFLPQWNLPGDLECSSKGTKIRYPEMATKYLWTLASMERRQLSRINIRNGKRAWEDVSSDWIFNPLNVVERGIDNVRGICKNVLQYTLNGFPENYLSNAERLIVNYSGDSRNVIDGKTTEQAREELMMFKGIGTGIANLFIIYLSDRGICSPIDYGERRIKVDVHKARIPINTNSVVSDANIRRDFISGFLENLYLEICSEHDLDAGKLDSALWTIGSEICAKRNYEKCLRECPLEKLCESCVSEDKKTGFFHIYDAEGGRLDSRKGVGQMLLF